jgi:septum formation protein
MFFIVVWSYPWATKHTLALCRILLLVCALSLAGGLPSLFALPTPPSNQPVRAAKPLSAHSAPGPHRLLIVRLVLASASPARLGVLRAAGLDPSVEVSEVDEDALLAEHSDATPQRRVTALAEAKAGCVAGRPVCAESVVVGCDSMLLVGGDLVGKPGTPEVARRRWESMAGRTGELITGHAVLVVRDGAVAARASAHASTVVHFAEPTDAEISAYVDSGEPLAVAGGFTLDGLGGWFVDRIEGDPSNVIGISLPLTRRLLTRVGVALPDLWRASRDR